MINIILPNKIQSKLAVKNTQITLGIFSESP